jgi:hypothetical protein
MAAFELHYRPTDNLTLARLRWEGDWLIPMAKRRARDLGWNGLSALTLFDADGLAIAGFIPAETVAKRNKNARP